VRWDSPIVLVIAGTAAIHTILLVFIDAMIVTNPLVIKPPAPKIEMFEVKVEPPPVIKPPVAPLPQPEPEQPKPVEPIKTQPRVAPQRVAQPVPPQPEQPKPTSEQSGGDPVVSMPDIAPSATGVAVGSGKPNTGRVGRGGTGGGTGAGSGSGTEDPPPPPPVSVATIKKRALPKGDYGYIDAGREYPQEARQRGIEGPIRVRLVVDATGKVTQATLINRLGHGLDELALAKAKKIEFEPATDTNDKPVVSVVVWTFNMTLPK
jgi:protein TonB